MDVLEALKMRPWTDQALCAQAPHDRMSWVIEPGSGIEPPGSVIKLLEVCRDCPVRAECLRDALSSTQIDVYGAWGGTMRSERHRVMTALHAGRLDDAMQYADTRAGLVEQAFEILFETIDLRINGWRRLADMRRIEMARTAPDRIRRERERRLSKRADVTARTLRPRGSCRTCDRAFTWATRAGTRFCSGQCRQAAYRYRAVA